MALGTGASSPASSGTVLRVDLLKIQLRTRVGKSGIFYAAIAFGHSSCRSELGQAGRIEHPAASAFFLSPRPSISEVCYGAHSPADCGTTQRCGGNDCRAGCWLCESAILWQVQR